jgi:heat shock protein HslJ
MKLQPASLSSDHRSSLASLRTMLSLVAAIAIGASFVTAAPASAQGDEFDPRRIEWPWQLLELHESGQATLVPPGIGITASLYRGVLTVEGACSTARGEYSLNEGSIAISPPEIETRGCDPAIQAVDDAFFAALQRVRTWRAGGGCEGTTDATCQPATLSLLDEVGEPVMTMTGATLPADPGLSRWELGRIGDGEGSIRQIIPGVQPWMEFQRGGHVVGDSGCGSFLGDYTVNSNTVSVGDIVTQAPDCPEALRAQADTIITTLGEVTDFEVLPAGLVLRDANGLTRLAFVPALDLGGRTWTPFEILTDGEALENARTNLQTSAVRFAGRQATGRTVCRSFRGETLSSGLARTVFEVAPAPDVKCRRTRKGGVPYQAVEDAFLGALARTASHALRGDELMLMDVEGNVITRLAPQADIADQTWVVSELDTAPNRARARPKPPKGEPPTASFSDPAIGVLQGSTGIRPYEATFSQPGGGQIDITDPLASGPGCGRGAARSAACVQERLFLALLEGATNIVVYQDEMRLLNGERVVLRFVPEDRLAAEQAAAAEAEAEAEASEDGS